MIAPVSGARTPRTPPPPIQVVYTESRIRRKCSAWPCAEPLPARCRTSGVSLKRPLRDGRTELAFTPIDFLRRLATLIPPPRSHLTRYHGVFAPNHHLRAAIVSSACTDQPHPSSRRRLNWADLLKRVFAVDVLVCDGCGGGMRILVVLSEGEASRTILEHLGLPTKPHPYPLAPPGRLFDDA